MPWPYVLYRLDSRLSNRFSMTDTHPYYSIRRRLYAKLWYRVYSSDGQHQKFMVLFLVSCWTPIFFGVTFGVMLNTKFFVVLFLVSCWTPKIFGVISGVMWCWCYLVFVGVFFSWLNLISRGNFKNFKKFN